MSRYQTVWGVDQVYLLILIVLFCLIMSVHLAAYPLFALPLWLYIPLLIVALPILALGIWIWHMAWLRIRLEGNGQRLRRQGVYGLCRHPIYGSLSCLIAPSLAIVMRSWLVLLLLPPVLYWAALRVIRQEEMPLRLRHGRDFAEYARDLSPLIPDLRRMRQAFFYPQATQQISEHLFALRTGPVNGYLYCKEGRHVAFDAGTSAPELLAALERLGFDPQRVEHVFLTHSDRDHTGGLDTYKGAEIHLLAEEEPLIDGSRARMFVGGQNPRLHRPYHLLQDGDTLEIGPIRIDVIATPGHTPGSTCYLVDERLLITGDALALRDDRAYPFVDLINMNGEKARRSLGRLARLDQAAQLCTGHTGCTDTPELALSAWRQGKG